MKNTAITKNQGMATTGFEVFSEKIENRTSVFEACCKWHYVLIG